MKIKDYFYTLKVCGLRWFIWFLPFWAVIPLLNQFGSSEKFNDKSVIASRLGNSGLFLIFSEEIQEKIRENVRKSRELDEHHRKQKIKEEYQKEFGNTKREIKEEVSNE